MARKAKQTFSSTGIVRPDYSIIQADMKPIKVGGLNRDYSRLVDDAMWYIHYEIDAKTLVKALIKYTNDTLGKDSARAMRKMPEHQMIVPGKWAYLVTRGARLSTEHEAMLNGKVTEMLALAEQIQDSESDTTDAPRGKVISIQERMWEQVTDLVTSFEQRFDQLMDSDPEFDHRKFDPHREIRAHQPEIKPAHAKMIRDVFDPQLTEFREVLEFTDPDIREAYPQLTARKAQRANLVRYLEAIVTACDTIINTGKAQRKTRARTRKAPDKAKLVAKLKFRENEPSLGLASINPLSIPDSGILWVYNTKTRKLGRYVADDGGVLTVKGTTIQGFDAAQSTQRTVRKPEILKGSGKLSRTKIQKLYDEIKTTEIKLTGRINEHTILISTF